MTYTIFHESQLDWHPRAEDDPRSIAALSDVVLDGTLTVHLGDGHAPDRHELARGSVLIVQPGTPLQLSNRGDEELRLFILGAPPERGQATFFERVE